MKAPVPGRVTPGRAPAPTAVLAFIVRRLLGAIVLLIVVSMVTFAIFFLVPRLAGQTTDQLAAQYVGRNPTRPRSMPGGAAARPRPAALRAVLAVPEGHRRRRALLGPGRTPCTARRRASATRSATSSRSGRRWSATSRSRCRWPSARPSLWLISGVATGVVSALRAGIVFDRLSMGIALAGVSLPIFFTGLLRWRSSATSGPCSPTCSTWPSPPNPLLWARNLVLPWITLAFLYAALYARLTRAGMLETMSEDYIRTARAKGLPERTVIVKHGLRAALTPILTIFGLDLGLLLGGAILTENTFSLHGLGLFAVDGDQQPGPAGDPRGDLLVAAFFIVSPTCRGPPVRRHRPAGEAVVTARRRPDGDRRSDVLSGDGTCASTSRPTTAWSRPSTGCRSRWSAAGRWASSASPAPARASPAWPSWACTTAATRADHRRDLARRRGAGRAPTRAGCAQLRGRKMAMIFQDPLSALHPFYTVGHQIIEAYRVHNDVSQAGRPQARHRHARPGRHPAARDAGSTTTRTSSPAACGSAR